MLRRILLILLALLMIPSLIGVGKVVLAGLLGLLIWAGIYLMAGFSLGSILLFLLAIIVVLLGATLFLGSYFIYFRLIYRGLKPKRLRRGFWPLYWLSAAVYAVAAAVLTIGTGASIDLSLFGKYWGLDFVPAFWTYPVLMVVVALVAPRFKATPPA